MMSRRSIDRAPGMVDHGPEGMALRRWIARELLETYESYGYEAVDVPIIEQADLYMRKAGAEFLASTYVLRDQGGRELALRPELTASLMRSYLARPAGSPRTVRWASGGPVFRYASGNRPRQFTHHGIELIGASGLLADAEVLDVVLTGLSRLGIDRPSLRLGHVAVVRSFMASLVLSERVEFFLLDRMEQLADGAATPESLWTALDSSGLLHGGADETLSRAIKDLPETEARDFVRRVLASMNASMTGSREPEEIVDRLLSKVRRADEGERAQRGIELVAALAPVHGEAFASIERGKAIAKAFGADPAPLEELAGLVEVIALRHPEAQIEISLGLARHMTYYTGLVFDVLAATGQPVCGGGRYDELSSALGGDRPVPALGCAFEVEALAPHVSRRIARKERRCLRADLGTSPETVLRVADALRAEGVIVTLTDADRESGAGELGLVAPDGSIAWVSRAAPAAVTS